MEGGEYERQRRTGVFLKGNFCSHSYIYIYICKAYCTTERARKEKRSRNDTLLYIGVADLHGSGPTLLYRRKICDLQFVYTKAFGYDTSLSSGSLSWEPSHGTGTTAKRKIKTNLWTGGNKRTAVPLPSLGTRLVHFFLLLEPIELVSSDPSS